MRGPWFFVSGAACTLVLGGACTLVTNLSGFTGGEGASDATVDGPSGSDATADGPGPAADGAGNDGSVVSTFGCGASDAGLLAYWPMDEGSGTAIADCSGHGLDGTLLGNGTWVAGRRPTTKAVRFDETLTTYINIPTSPLTDAATTITLAAWVNLGVGYNSYVVHKGQPPTMSWSLEMESDGSVSLYISTDGNAYAQAHSTAAPTLAWFHLAAVYEAGKTETIYVNGIAVNSVAAPTTMYQSALPLKIGWHTRGMIDEVRVFSRALSATEIQTLAAE